MSDLCAALLAELQRIQAMERQEGESQGPRIIMEVRAFLAALGDLIEPEDCKGVMGGKISITHLFISKTCARCGLTKKEVAAARATSKAEG